MISYIHSDLIWPLVAELSQCSVVTYATFPTINEKTEKNGLKSMFWFQIKVWMFSGLKQEIFLGFQNRKNPGINQKYGIL